MNEGEYAAARLLLKQAVAVRREMGERDEEAHMVYLMNILLRVMGD